MGVHSNLFSDDCDGASAPESGPGRHTTKFFHGKEKVSSEKKSKKSQSLRTHNGRASRHLNPGAEAWLLPSASRAAREVKDTEDCSARRSFARSDKLFEFCISSIIFSRVKGCRRAVWQTRSRLKDAKKTAPMWFLQHSDQS